MNEHTLNYGNNFSDIFEKNSQLIHLSY